MESRAAKLYVIVVARQLVPVALGVIAVGCEPIVLDIGPEPVEAPTLLDAATVTDAAPPEGAAVDFDATLSRLPDAEVDAAGEADASNAATRKCVSIAPTLIGGVPESLQSHTLKELSCPASEAGEGPNTGVYTRQDGLELMKRGTPYSLHWSGFLVSLRIYGGSFPCATQKIFEEMSDNDALQFSLPNAACRDVVPEFDVTHLRTIGASIPGTVVELCAERCEAQ